VALARAADPVADDPRQGIEPGGAVSTTLAHLLAEQLGDRTAPSLSAVEVERRSDLRLAIDGRHRHDRGRELAQVMLGTGRRQDLHQPGGAGLGVHAAGDADRLVRGAERQVAADLAGDGMAQPADGSDVLTLGGLAELPVEVELALALGGQAA
jgi:hypothetical protein